MDIQSLEAFVTVADLGSFSLAAEKLHLTQPAISKRIAGLEDNLKTPVFDRVGRQITMTHAGRLLYDRAKTILLDIEDTYRAIGSLSSRVTGKLKIGTSHHVGLRRLPTVLKAFSQKYPDVKLDIRFLDSEKVCQSVLAGDIEFGISTLPNEPETPLEARIVWPDPLSICVSRNHPLASKGHVTLRDVAQYEAILPSKLTFTYRILKEAFQQEGQELRVALATNYLETIKMLVSVGLGWSALPKTMLDENLVELPITELNIERNLGLVTHSKRQLSNAAKAFIQLAM